MHVFLTGAAGFIGSYVLRALRDRGHTVRGLVHDAEKPLPGDAGDAVEKVQGDITKRSSLDGLLDGCEAVVHLVGIIDEKPSKGLTFEAVYDAGTRHVVEAARAAGIDRFVFMSANGARPHAPSRYHTTKWQAEQHVKGAGFAHWTIFRPSIIFGDPGLHNVSFEVRLSRQLIRPFPILPVFGDGEYRLQPISVEEVAAAFAQAVTSEAANGQIYGVGGQATYSYNEVLDIITRGLGLPLKPKLHVPLWLVRPLVLTLGRIGLLPISPAQFQMLVEGNTCDAVAFYRDFEVQHQPFTPENLRAYLPGRV